MDGALINELKLLEENSKKVDNSIIYDLMIFSIKGKYNCEEQRKQFVLNRTLPIQKMYDPSFIKPQAQAFLDCYADMVKTSKTKCPTQYQKVFECLKGNHLKSDNFPTECVPQMEDFLYC
jgi:hypothetical protein